jgi:hypothetical protein
MQHGALAQPRYVDYRIRGLGSRRFMTARATENFGRLVRVTRSLGHPNTVVAYIVAKADPTQAIELIRTQAAQPHDVIEDLGRVSDALLQSLNLTSGKFVRADEPRGARRIASSVPLVRKV